MQGGGTREEFVSFAGDEAMVRAMQFVQELISSSGSIVDLSSARSVTDNDDREQCVAGVIGAKIASKRLPVSPIRKTFQVCHACRIALAMVDAKADFFLCADRDETAPESDLLPLVTEDASQAAGEATSLRSGTRTCRAGTRTEMHPRRGQREDLHLEQQML
jgi:hypothetical protein